MEEKKFKLGKRMVFCPWCKSENLKVTPDEVDVRFDNYDCKDCGCHFQVDR